MVFKLRAIKPHSFYCLIYGGKTMIQTKVLTFHHNGIDFEASICYSDAPFGDRLHSKDPIFFNVQLLKPLSLNCGGESVKIGGMSVKSMKRN